MLELFLWRHAKAVPAAPCGGDRARPLSRRGRRDAERVARWLAPRVAGARILCSPARRTRETAAALIARAGAEFLLRRSERLYLASAAQLLARLRAQPEHVRCVVLIGHNPGLHELALRLIGTPPRGKRAWLRERLPTAALARIRVRKRRWRELSEGCGELVSLVRPAPLAQRR
jgi:phosphohistidine phosphatase